MVVKEIPQRQALDQKVIFVIIVVKEVEVKLLKMMYDDLAIRSKEKKLTREVFDTFFHLNGLWGQEMFRIFDKNKEGVIDFRDFVSSIELLVRGTHQQRSRLLF